MTTVKRAQTYCIMHNVLEVSIHQGDAVFLQQVQDLPELHWTTKRGTLYQDCKRKTRERKIRRVKRKKEITWGRVRTDCSSEGVCKSMKNIFRYKKSNSGQSENIPPRVSVPPHPWGGWGRKRWWPHYQPPHTPPLGALRAQGSFLHSRQLHK